MTFADEGWVGGHWGSAGSGLLLTTGTRVLLLLRSADVQQPGVWGIPGGAIPRDRATGERMDALVSAHRETEEELGANPPPYEVIGQLVNQAPDGFVYITLVGRVTEAAADALGDPPLNWESDDSVWATEEQIAGLPVHSGVTWALDRARDRIFDRGSAARRWLPDVSVLDASVKPDAAVAYDAAKAMYQDVMLTAGDALPTRSVLGGIVQFDARVSRISFKRVEPIGYGWRDRRSEVRLGLHVRGTEEGFEGTYYTYWLDPAAVFAQHRRRGSCARQKVNLDQIVRTVLNPGDWTAELGEPQLAAVTEQLQAAVIAGPDLGWRLLRMEPEPLLPIRVLGLVRMKKGAVGAYVAVYPPRATRTPTPAMRAYRRVLSRLRPRVVERRMIRPSVPGRLWQGWAVWTAPIRLQQAKEAGLV